MEIYYDTEFVDTPEETKLLSIGMVTEDGREYYAILDDPDNIRAAAKNPWLVSNVLNYFPLAKPIDPEYPFLDESHEDYIYVKSQAVIAREVRDFIWSVPNPSLWAWFAAYDHVMLSRLFGRMLDLPPGIPMFTNDLMTEVTRLGNPVVPNMPGVNSHNALSDAREVKWRREYLLRLEYARSMVIGSD